MTSRVSVLNKKGCICPQCKDEVNGDHRGWQTLFNSSDLFYKFLKQCGVRGLVVISGCKKSDTHNRINYTKLVQELIERDILVIFSGCFFKDIIEADLLSHYEAEASGAGLAELCDFLEIPPILYVEEEGDIPCINDFLIDLAERAGTELINLPIVSVPDGFSDKFDIKQVLNDPYLVDNEIHEKRLALKWYDHFDARHSDYS
jgi:hypothetical protein